jgi:hypothetical protein
MIFYDFRCDGGSLCCRHGGYSIFARKLESYRRFRIGRITYSDTDNPVLIRVYPCKSAVSFLLFSVILRGLCGKWFWFPIARDIGDYQFPISVIRVHPW